MLVLVTILYPSHNDADISRLQAFSLQHPCSIPIPSPGPIDCDSVGDVHKLRSDVGIHVQLNNQERNPQKAIACIMHQVNLY
jgi:hypothetical protein